MLSLLALIVGGIALVVASEKSVGAESSEGYVPTDEDILLSQNFEELNAYYELIGELSISNIIDSDSYMLLYLAYETRHNEILVGQ